jgi:hypothetical protein
MMQCSPVRGGQPFEEKNVEIINNAEELMAVGGGKLRLQNSMHGRYWWSQLHGEPQ